MTGPLSEIDEAVWAFLMAVFICPLALVAALIGSVFAFLRSRSAS